MRESQQRTLLSVVLCVASLLNLSIILSSRSREKFPDTKREYSWIGHDYPEELPLPMPLESVAMTGEESGRFLLHGEPSDEPWAKVAPASGGFIRLGPHNRLFLLSMFHQVHCMRFFNWAFDPKFEDNKLYFHFATPGHSAHCLNYIRQATICNPDLTLEPGDFTKRNFTVDRVGATHTCRDWTAVYAELDRKYLESNGSALHTN